MRILVPFGTRPEIVKLAPVVDALRDHGHDVHALATGQHDDPLLADAFFADLGLEPDERWELPNVEADRVGAILSGAYEVIARVAPDALVLLGDTHTVPLFGLSARRHTTPVVHLEAGLRSFNERSLEEVNRRAVAAMTSLHLAPTVLAERFLRREGHDEAHIRVVGNPITDTLRLHGPSVRPVQERSGIVVTAHRATTVDDPDSLSRLVDLLLALTTIDTVRFPVHPRTRSRLTDAGLYERLDRAPGISLEEPLRYPDMLDSVAGARLLVTDSGGLQEEASWFGVPVLVLRTSTPRWEGVIDDTARLVGLDLDRALAAATQLTAPEAQLRVSTTPCPYGDGHVAERVASLLTEPSTAAALALHEPLLRDGLPDAVTAASPSWVLP